MIAVIADDFTGAAELAGIGLRYSLKIQLAMPGVAYDGSDLFIVSTDSRSLNREDAVNIHAKVVEEIIKLKPAFIYKKIDSVLRGHILDELKIQMKITGKQKAFVLAANPSLGRTIHNGVYYVEGTPIDSTGFATDPEFAITDSSVLKMIDSRGGEKVLKAGDILPSAGIILAEASTVDDVNDWAGRINNDSTIAGAGDLFSALLDKQFSRSQHPDVNLELPHLYISGTSFEQSKKTIAKINEGTGCVAYLPAARTLANNEIQKWLKKVHGILAEQKRCVVAIDENTTGASALELREYMADIIKTIVKTERISELFIEGGSTAAAILNKLDISSLKPVNELQRGVTRMKANDVFITVKPGSYSLPSQIANLYN
jgi:D-threonate/D-erythronate kinase